MLANPDDEVALLRVINTPTRGIGKVTVDRVKTFAGNHGLTVSQALAQADRISEISGAAKTKLMAFARLLEKFRQDMMGKVAPLAERVFRESGLEDSFRGTGQDGQDALENIGELINAAAVYDQQAAEPSLLDYLQQIALFSDTDAYEATNERAALMTLHAAKGLEFDHVFVIGLEDGLLPHERGSGDGEELEEERRLFFVGVTRARTNLYLSYARYRTVRGQFLRTVASPFLFELGLDQMLPEDAQSEEDDRAFTDYRRPQRPAVALRPKATNQAEPEFAPGQLVRHKTFGLGRVQKYADMGANSVVTVQFNTGQTKSLLLQYANLSKV